MTFGPTQKRNAKIWDTISAMTGHLTMLNDRHRGVAGADDVADALGHRPGHHDRQHDQRGQQHDDERHEELERLELPELAPLLDLVDDVGGLHVAADVARGRPQRAEPGPRSNAKPAVELEPWRSRTALVTTSRAAAGRERAEVLEQRVDGGRPGQPEQGQQHDQRGEERQHPVVGERRRQQREVVLLELTAAVRLSVSFHVRLERSVGLSGARSGAAVSAIAAGLPASGDGRSRRR